MNKHDGEEAVHKAAMFRPRLALSFHIKLNNRFLLCCKRILDINQGSHVPRLVVQLDAASDELTQWCRISSIDTCTDGHQSGSPPLLLSC